MSYRILAAFLNSRGKASAIRFAVHLHQELDYSLSDAYSIAVDQFRSLRSEFHTATTVAAEEAEAYGAEFGPSSIEVGFAREFEAMQSWKKDSDIDEGAIAARKRWKVITERYDDQSAWTKGEEYVKLWKEVTSLLI